MRLEHFEKLSTGLWRVSIKKRSSLDHSELEKISWTSAQVFDHREGSKIVDYSYRSAKVAGTVHAPNIIALLEKEALDEVMPQIINLPFQYDNLKLEGSQLIKYGKGDFFRPHRDAVHQHYNRVLTLLKYIVNPVEGGRTIFPELGKICEPEEETWSIFYSEHLHCAEHILAGEKIVFATWLVRA